MKKTGSILGITLIVLVLTLSAACSSGGGDALQIKNGIIEIPLAGIDDGKAHFFKTAAADGTQVSFFTLKSKDGIYRAAVDACDVCYQSGKGYHQEGDFMVCDNCGQKFASDKINVIKGGCNPAPLERTISNDKLLIAMAEIDKNSWYCQFKK